MKPAAGALALLLLSCQPAPREAEALGEIPESAFGIVGETALPLQLLSGSAPQERSRQAQSAVRDELFRQELIALGPHRAQVAERGVLARRLIEELESEVVSAHPPSEEQMRAEWKRRWLEYDRPRAVRTIQLYFPVDQGPLVDDRPVYEKAQRVHQAVQGTFNAREFGRAAASVLDEKDAKEYEMPPFAEDGRIVPVTRADARVESMAAPLALAAGKLRKPGDISEIVGTDLGYHILYATEVIPEKRVSFEEARDELRRLVVAQRVQSALNAITEEPQVTIVRKRDDISNLLSLIVDSQ